MNKTALIVLLAFTLTPLCAAATLYKWTDKNGVVHYSDQPHKGAKPVNLPGLTSFSAPPVPEQGREKQTGAPAKPYDTFTITFPKPEGTIHANDGQVAVTVMLDPPLRQGDKLVYTLDNKQAGAAASTSIKLTHVQRGAHTVSVSVIDANGETVQQAQPVKFYVRHNSQLFQKNPAMQFSNGKAGHGAFQFPHGKNPP
ncbi:MAG TPA: DUF4124 domain-containing protein [Gammaproteobacteria bacterium]|nr:DUF4124 domain-containing protein [Gammaproteobacteria bacterium]